MEGITHSYRHTRYKWHIVGGNYIIYEWLITVNKYIQVIYICVHWNCLVITLTEKHLYSRNMCWLLVTTTYYGKFQWWQVHLVKQSLLIFICNLQWYKSLYHNLTDLWYTCSWTNWYVFHCNTVEYFTYSLFLN